MSVQIILGEGDQQVVLSSVAGWGSLTVTDKWDTGGSGPYEATWEMTLPPMRRPKGLDTNVPCVVMVGGCPRFAGRVPDLDWSAGEFSAIGAVRESEEAIALTAAGLTTATPDAAIDAAIARGALTWKRRASLSASTIAADGDETDDQFFIQALLDAWADSVGKRWAVNARREVYAAADPTTPSWFVLPGAGEFGTDTDLMVGKLYARYKKNTTGDLGTVTAGAGLPEVAIDLTGRGTLTQAQAQQVLNGIYTKASKQKNFTNSLELNATQILTPGGLPARPYRVRAGQMMRFLALRDERNGKPYTDIVLGETEWDAEADTVTVTPIDMSNRDLESFVEEAGGSIVS